MTQFIVRTNANNAYVLGGGGVSAIDAESQIKNAIRRRLGNAHADLFAAPERNPETGDIDWLSAHDDAPVKLTSLPVAEQVQHRQTLAKLLSDVKALAAELQTGADRSYAAIGRMISDAVNYPSDEAVYVAGGQPVLVMWGAKIEKPGVGEEALTHEGRGRDAALISAPRPPEPVSPARPSAAAPPAPPLPAPAAAPVPVAAYYIVGANPWLAVLSWFALFAFTGIMTLLLAPACGVTLPFGGALSWCEQDGARAEAAALDEESAGLERKNEELQTAINDRACPEAPAARAAEIDERREEQGGKKGKVTVTLIWDGPQDLDLYVGCPGGQKIYYSNKSACGGTLDVDMNYQTHSQTPVENIYWGGPPEAGRYDIQVKNHKGNQAGRAKYTVRVEHEGGRTQTFQGEIGESTTPDEVGSFTID